MISCDLCGKAGECLQKRIDGKEFDICEACWRPLEEKLSGKGRVKENADELDEDEETII
jgi:ribosome-binding protein aMBF1 (putative translation factor)